MDMSELLIKMFIFVVLLITGYFLARSGRLDDRFSHTASDLTINVFTVATIIASATNSDFTMSNGEFFTALGICFLTVGLCFVFGFLIMLPFSKRESSRVTELLIASPNMMFIGVPVAQVVFGAKGVLLLALSCFPFNVIVYTYGVYRLIGGKGDNGLKGLISPPLIATVIAAVLMLTGIRLPRLFTTLVDTTAGATLPMSMVVIGASLGTMNVKGLFGDLRIYGVAFAKLILTPVLIYLILSLFVRDHVLLGCMAIYGACPCGILTPILTLQYDLDNVYASKGVLMTTALSMLTIPAIIYLLQL